MQNSVLHHGQPSLTTSTPAPLAAAWGGDSLYHHSATSGIHHSRAVLSFYNEPQDVVRALLASSSASPIFPKVSDVLWRDRWEALHVNGLALIGDALARRHDGTSCTTGVAWATSPSPREPQLYSGWVACDLHVALRHVGRSAFRPVSLKYGATEGSEFLEEAQQAGFVIPLGLLKPADSSGSLTAHGRLNINLLLK